MNGLLFFTAAHPTAGTELWKSDGTDAGTVLVKDIVPGTGSGFDPYSGVDPSLTNVDGTLFFAAGDLFGGVTGVELWKSDGTEAGTAIVEDIVPGGSGSFPRNLTAVNGTLFFTAYTAATGVELWKSDGTASGTDLVMNINPGTDFQNSPQHLTDVNGTLYFTANNGVSGEELWQSDGFSAGTSMVQDINPGAAGSTPQLLVSAGGKLFFAATDISYGRELWTVVGRSAPSTEIDLAGMEVLRPAAELTGVVSSSARSLSKGSGTMAEPVQVAPSDQPGRTLLKRSGTTLPTKLIDVIEENLADVI
jgi:ELWxxDGT repeat protein